MTNPKKGAIQPAAPQGRADVTVAQVQSFSMQVLSPLPPPEMLAGYQQIHPDLVPKLIEWVDRQSSHRIQCEALMTKAEASRIRWAPVFAVAVFFAYLGLVGFAIAKGQGWTAAVLGAIPVGAVIAHFFRRKGDSSKP